jgi:hypothetical protein
MLFFGMEASMNATFSFLISVGIIALASGLSLARSPLARRWLGRSWDYSPPSWVRSAFMKQLATSKSRSSAIPAPPNP